MFLLIYGLLRILFNVCGDLIVEKLLPWVLECFNMFGLNKKLCPTKIVDDDMWIYYISYASWLCEGKWKKKFIESFVEMVKKKKWW